MIARISGTLLYLFSSLVYRTCQIFVTGEEYVYKALEHDGPVILTSWHGMTMMVAAFARKYFDTSTFAGIAPDDNDGKILDVFGRKLGILVAGHSILACSNSVARPSAMLGTAYALPCISDVLRAGFRRLDRLDGLDPVWSSPAAHGPAPAATRQDTPIYTT